MRKFNCFHGNLANGSVYANSAAEALAQFKKLTPSATCHGVAELFKSESQAFAIAGDRAADLCKAGRPNCGFRVLKTEGGFKVAMVPERGDGAPFYL